MHHQHQADADEQKYRYAYSHEYRTVPYAQQAYFIDDDIDRVIIWLLKARLVSYWVDLWLQDISLSLAHHLTSLVVEKLCNYCRSCGKLSSRTSTLD